jgi:hypothetical protein
MMIELFLQLIISVYNCILLIGPSKISYSTCHNPNLGFATKARACKGAGQEGSPGVTSHVFESAKECEGMNLHTPK